MDPVTDHTRPPILALLVLTAVLATGAVMRIAHHMDVDSRSPDEETYTGYASSIADGGIRAFPKVFSDYEQAGDVWVYPAPTRVGEILLTVAVMKLENVRDEQAGADLSLAASIMTLLLTAWIGMRFFDPWTAVAATAFLAFSVPELGIARRAWTDSLVGLTSLCLVLIVCVISRSENRRRTWLYILFLAAGCGALLVKESLAVYYGICGLWLTAQLWFQEKSARGAAMLAAGGIVSVTVALLIVRVLCGDQATFVALLPHPGNWLLPHPESWTTENYGGPWYQMFGLLWNVGPLTAVMALAGFIALAAHKRARTATALVVAAIAGICVLFLTFAPALKCLRLLSPADGCYALMAGLGLSTLLAVARSKMGRVGYGAMVAAAVLAVTIEGLCNYRSYTAAVVDSGMEDLAISGLRFWLR
jgi:4-amino-4-deoxy-L-arabinose transferase-like glycosyltransferase